jgi:hypothetical protein
MKIFNNKIESEYNKPCIRFASQRTFQHVDSLGAEILFLILTSMQLVYLNTQKMKVVDIFLRVPRHLESS